MKKIIISSFILFLSLIGIPNVTALSTGEQYSEFSTKKVQLGSIHTTAGSFAIYGYNGVGSSCSSSTAPINCWYNGTNSLVTYGGTGNESRSQYAIKFLLNSSLVQGNTYDITMKFHISDSISYNYSYYFTPLDMTNLTINSSSTTNSGNIYTTVYNVTAKKTTSELYIDYVNNNPLSLSLLNTILAGIYYPQVVFVSGPGTDLSGVESKTQTIIDQNQTIIQQNEETKQEIEDLNDNITSTDITESENKANSFFEGFESDDYGLSDIITMPLELIKGLTSNACVALNLTLPFVNKSFDLPCMSSIYQEYFGSFFTLYQTITFGFVAYWVIVKIFALVKGFKDPDDDKVEVMDL